MGYRIIRSKPITVDQNEEIDLKFKLRPENRGVIHGVVVDPEDNPVKDVLVKLFQKQDCNEKLKPIAFQFTDKCGQFLFPVEPNIEHIIKIAYIEKETCIYSINDELYIEPENG